PKSVSQTERSPAPTPPEPSRSKLAALGVASSTPFPKILPPCASDDAWPAPALLPTRVNVTSPSAFANFRTVFAAQFVNAFWSSWSEQNARSGQFERSITIEQPPTGLFARLRAT